MRKTPRPTGSWRTLSPEGLESAARRVVRQSAMAAESARPVAWLALVLFDLDRHRPPGARRADARSHIATVAAVMASCGDYRSGRRVRPGRQVCAGVAGLSERSVQRYWRLLESRRLATLTVDGRVLAEHERVTDLADPWPEPDATDLRWRNRAEWTLTIPAWAWQITDEALLPCITQAAGLLAGLAARVGQVPSTPLVDEAGGKPVDNRAGQGVFVDGRPGSVALSLVLKKVVNSLPVHRRCSFPSYSSVGNADRGGSGRPFGRRPKGGAPRHRASTRGGRSGRRRQPPDMVRLAHQLVGDDRLPFLVGPHVHLPRVTAVLGKLRGWTADDVVAEAELRLAECGKTMLGYVEAPHGYLHWLLRHARPDDPPGAHRLLAPDPVPVRLTEAGTGARQLARSIAEQAADDGQVAAADRRARRQRLGALDPPLVVERTCMGGCGGYGMHVQPVVEPFTGHTRMYCPDCLRQVRVGWDDRAPDQQNGYNWT